MEELREFLNDTDLTQTEVASRLGMTQTNLSYVVTGRRQPSPEFLWRWENTVANPDSVHYVKEALAVAVVLRRSLLARLEVA